MRHLYRCPLRWADLDLLGHVNNVTYVDYLQEARVDMFRTHAPDSRAEDLAEGVVVVRHEVTYVSSLTFGFEPVSIECWVTEIRAASFTMAYEVFEEDESGERTVFLRARTVLTPYVFATERPRRLHAEERESLGRLLEPDEPVRPPAAPEVVDVPGGHYPVHVRFSDVDVYGHVNNVKYFEYFQEARIQLMVASGRELGQGHHLVVAQTDVDYRRPILFRPEPYDCSTWVSHIGSTSVVFESVVRDGDEVLARARVVGVCIDSATGRPAPVPEEFRDIAGVVTPSS
ncbi:thioesterase family protein [Nocardioides sp. STR2]|uniref:Thioesterase family protein n=1 Tax=Nocardioides pini TaxID=2975053 RepID=A0ABT4CGE4_9ACTN|nr:thioesterase family protein [Nocardioides pini]MCY4727876.1 thioesterase family protein [Nocardioides pini]